MRSILIYLLIVSSISFFPLLVTHHLTMKDRCPQSDRCSELCPHGYSLRTKIEEECPVCECKRHLTGS